MRLDEEKLAVIDTSLAGFIAALVQSRPVGGTLLRVDGAVLEKLAANPSPGLRRAWQELGRRKFMRFPANSLKQSGSATAVFRITPALLGLAVILHNQIGLRTLVFDDENGLTTRHDLELFEHLPVPRNLSDILSFDLLISEFCQVLRTEREPASLNSLAIELLNFSPFSALKAIDLMLPLPLNQLAPAYLPHWPAGKCLIDLDEWWSWVDKILAQPVLAQALKNTWFELVENRSSCLGLGIFLEELRHRGQYDQFILSYFEAYEFLQKNKPANSGSAQFDLVGLIKTQLSASGDSLSGRRLNQIGNEYFLKFRALLEIVADRGGVPGEFRHLSHDFCFKRLLPLVSLATITGGQRLEQNPPVKFSEVRFS